MVEHARLRSAVEPAHGFWFRASSSELEKGIVARNDFKEGEGNTEPPKTAATNLRIFLEYQESDTLLICEVLKSIRI